jgi:hypothetical protein
MMSAANGQSQTTLIDPIRAVDWSLAGVSGGIPTRTTVCATLPAGASSNQIDGAIAGCGANQVVQLSPGTYTLTSGITIARNNVTLRGAGPDKTFIVFAGGNPCTGLWTNVCIKNSAGGPHSDNPGTVANWTSGYAKDTKTITLSTTSGLAVGHMLVLDQLDDGNTDTGQIWICAKAGVCALDGGAAGRPGRAQMQFVKVTAISGQTVTFTPGLAMPNWRPSQQPQAWWIDPARGIGIEDLSMDHTATAPTSQSGIFMFNSMDSWVKNVRSVRANRNHIWFFEAAHITVRDSYFYSTVNGASQSYGVETWMSSDLLIENNIFQRITAPMLTHNTTGTVYGYNYALDDYYFAPNWQQASSYFHDTGVNHVLWEGNDGIGWTADNTHGPAHFATAFRNYWNGRDGTKTAQTSPIIIMGNNRYMNLLGNVLGTPGYHTAYECAPASTTTASCNGQGDVSIYTIGWSGNQGAKGSLPNDPLVQASMFRWGNYDVTSGTRFSTSEVPSTLSPYGNAVPTSTVLPASLYLPAKPGWFNAPWPAIGPDVNGGDVAGLAGHVYKIPARQCFEKTPTSNGMLNFNANNCYSAATGTAPAAPTNLRIVR